MSENKGKSTRRQFLGTATAGAAAGAAIVTASGTAVGVETKGRGDYAIFQPGQIGKLKLKNRMIRSAAYMSTGSKDPATEGEVTEDTIRIHRTYAENDLAMTMTGYMNVMNYGKKFSHVSASHDKYIPGLAKVADAIHGVGNGCLLAAEIGHDGTSSPSREGMINTMLSPTGEEWPRRIGPSGIDWRGEENGHVMTVGEIERFVTDMGDAGRRLKEAGWDGCNLHGAHHYLINTFLSPFTNRRTDDYGGSMYKRIEIVRQIVKDIREKAGPDFAIIIKLNCDDGRVDDGTPEEQNIDTFPAIAKMIEECGVDAIDVSGDNPIRSNIDDPEDQSYYKQYTARLDNLTIPVMLSGGNRHVDLLEGIFKKQEGKVDFYCFARPLIREPHLIKQWLEGGDPKSTCTNISLCFREMGVPPFLPAHCVQLKREQQAREEAEKEARAYYPSQEGLFGA